jgi:lipoyl(octanoyl) transferase
VTLAGDRPSSCLAPLAQVTPRWAILVTPPLPGADNMALDHALMLRAARTGEATLRIYTWRTPTLSFGRHEAAITMYDRAAIEAEGLSVVRRPTGGRAVLHDDEITYSVTAPLSAGHPGSSSGSAPRVVRRAHARAIYTAINHLLLQGLARLGVAAQIASGDSGTDGPRPLLTGPCFDAASDGELVVGGRKLIGSAQWREDGAVLQHGSMLISGHRARLAALSARSLPIPALPSPAAALRELLPRVPSPVEVAAAFAAVLDDALAAAGAPAARVMSPGDETDAMTAAMRDRYEDETWTWRR